MGWVADGALGHEGWVANVLTDGRVAAGTCSGGVIVRELTADDVAAEREIRRFGSDEVDVVVPWDQVVSWRLMCDCGWTGTQRPAEVAADEPGYRGCDARPDIEAAFEREWATHIAPLTALDDLERLTAKLHDLQARIEDKVRTARAGGASWSQLGQATGISRQGAQQRWGHLAAT